MYLVWYNAWDREGRFGMVRVRHLWDLVHVWVNLL